MRGKGQPQSYFSKERQVGLKAGEETFQALGLKGPLWVVEMDLISIEQICKSSLSAEVRAREHCGPHPEGRAVLPLPSWWSPTVKAVGPGFKSWLCQNPHLVASDKGLDCSELLVSFSVTRGNSGLIATVPTVKILRL